MSEFFDYDPLTGVTTLFDYEEDTGNAIITEQQDVSPILEYAKKIRNDSLTDKGIKEEWWRYCIIPAVVQTELLQKGINIMSPDTDQLKRAFKEINQNYPYLKLTEKRHE